MVEHFRTALCAVVAADDTWRAGTMARSSAEYVALDAACRNAGLHVNDARRVLAALDHMEALTRRRMTAAMYWRAGEQRTRARQHFPDSAAWRFYMGEYSACLAAAQAMEVPHV